MNDFSASASPSKDPRHSLAHSCGGSSSASDYFAAAVAFALRSSANLEFPIGFGEPHQ